MTYPVIVPRQAEIEANAFGMTDMQVAVGFGRKACFNPSVPLAGKIVFFDDIAYEIGSRRCYTARCSFFVQTGPLERECLPVFSGNSWANGNAVLLPPVRLSCPAAHYN
jgi:hypothetical protein